MSVFSLSVPFRMANTRMANQSTAAFNQTDVVTFRSLAPNAIANRLPKERSD